MIAPGRLGLVEALRSSLLNEFFVDVTALGSFTVAASLVIGLYFLEDKSYFQTAFTGLISTAIIVHVLKPLLAVARPEKISWLVEPSTQYGFPSGHSATAAVMVTVLAGKKKGLKKYLYTLAVLVCFSRFYLGVHHISSIVAGALLGYIAGKSVLKYEEELENFYSKSKIF